MYKICITIIALLLSGCATFADQCTEAGYVHGSQSHAACVSQKISHATAIMGMMSQSVQQAGQSYQAGFQQPPAYTRPVQTTCVPVGNTIQCRSY